MSKPKDRPQNIRFSENQFQPVTNILAWSRSVVPAAENKSLLHFFLNQWHLITEPLRHDAVLWPRGHRSWSTDRLCHRAGRPCSPSTCSRRSSEATGSCWASCEQPDALVSPQLSCPPEYGERSAHYGFAPSPPLAPYFNSAPGAPARNGLPSAHLNKVSLHFLIESVAFF